MRKFWLNFVLLSFMILYCEGRKKECYVDEEGDKFDPNNIYKCELDQTCCKEEGKNSCCRVKESSVALAEQLQLWGTLLGFVIVVALLMWFCRHDGDCCCNAKDGRHSCCGYAYGKRPEDHYVDGRETETDEQKDKEKEAEANGVEAKEAEAKEAEAKKAEAKEAEDKEAEANGTKKDKKKKKKKKADPDDMIKLEIDELP